METRTVEQVESWSSRSVADGYAGLRELSDGEFSGAVRAGGAWLFMLNGRIIGVFEGSLDDFEDASGTAYAAPHPSLPLVFAMQEQGGDTRAKYYTNDTPLTEVDSTLSDGKFTGFVELSENVLSGDYYVAYYGGRSMSVAFVGTSEQVVTGDEAFERAADEVGIYEVTDVDLEVIDVPEPDEPEDEDEPTGAAAGGASDATAGSTSDPAGASTGTSGSATGATDDASGTTDGVTDDATGTTGGATADSGGATAGGSSAGSTTGRAASGDSSESTASGTSAESSGPTGEPTPPSSPGESTGGESATGRPSPDRPADQSDATDDRAASTPDRADAADRPSQRESAGASSTDSPATDASATPDARPGPSDAEPTAGPDLTGDSDPTATPDRTADVGRTADASRTADADRAASPQGTAESARTTDAPRSSETTATDRDTSASKSASAAGAAGGASSATEEEAEWRETTTIPSLDPELSDGPDEASGESGAGAAATGASTDRRAASDSPAGKQSRSEARATQQGQSGARSASGTGSGPTGSRQTGERSKDATGAGNAGGSGTGSAAAGGSNAAASESTGSGDAEARVRKLRKQLQQRKQQVEQLKERLSTLESERNEFKRERDALRQEVERLEAKLEGAPSGGATDAAGRQLSPAEAFEGTNLFVRYRSKGEATLDEAAEGTADSGDVNDNLRLEHHTQFEADDATVDDEPFDAFLTNSFEYEFVSWLVEDLLYEIRDTGHQDGLGDLYEAIPKIDRVDLHGSVSAGRDDEDTRQESFDVIVRDRMGDPLVVADLNDSREPTSGEMMGSLVDAASGVTERHDELAGAFQVTESFFEPEALETAEAATSGGFLSREKRASFVKLSRKRGYHLCLVEARGDDFHLNVPEL